MKKYLLGITAVVITVLVVAFTEPKNNAAQVDMYVFEFDHTQTGGYSVANVEDESNTYWKYVGLNQSLCAGNDVKACRVAVTSAYVNNPSSPSFLTDVIITADESTSGVAYVTSITAPSSNQYSNKP